MKHYFYRLLVLFGFVFWVFETGAFGWNETPINILERIADAAAWIMIPWGVIGDIAVNLTIHKTVNMKSKNININGKPSISIGNKK